MTLPRFHRQGLLGKLLSAAWKGEQLRSAVVCVGDDNPASLAANQRLGFRRIATVSFSNFGLFRIQSLSSASQTRPVTRISIATPWENRGGLTVKLDESGGLIVNDRVLAAAPPPSEA
jgi:hypothetical protein